MFNVPYIAEYMSIIIQNDETIYSLFVTANSSTCFGWYLHPLSGPHITACRVYGIIVAVTVDAVI